MSGAIPPGAPLIERQLAAAVGVSRTPVREALAMLESEELAVVGASGQLVVREVAVSDIRETYDVRVMLEGYAASLAAEARSDVDLRRLKLINDELRKSFRLPTAAQDVAVQTRLDARFHKGIAAASGNRTLARLVGLLVDTPIRERAFFWFSRERHLLSVRHHTGVLEALACRDAAEAENLWKEHIRLGGESLLMHLLKTAEAARDEELWDAVDADSATSTRRTTDAISAVSTSRVRGVKAHDA
jgi:DNA-binding GntR family transcriptional regulator